MSNNIPAGAGRRTASAFLLVISGLGLSAATLADSDGLSAQTRQELARARNATAAFHNIDAAYAAGYIDINVVIPGMGCHLLNPGYLDGSFNVSQPEALVYGDCTPGIGGRAELRAVEYLTVCGGPPACTLPAPAGFTGDDDAWTPTPDGALWTLHAWIWQHNPDGIFAPTSPHAD
ncbi:MAG TPA: hypothetical protein VD701_07025 [Steroidobacteraceae bacterium]|nr:hypothetical protein [Steroidobacteraceae bacterium]